jgi:FtsP/CotA-like multicopper oxidase with cupredoxin domain
MPSITRRQFFAGVSALALMPNLARATEIRELRAGPAKVQVAPAEYPQTDVWAFDGAVPGTMIRVGQGARVQRRLVNALKQDTAVHWHGLRIDNAMDGVPGLTQDAVKPGGGFLYDFTVPDAGTYWYHSHNQSTEQVARGLYGVLIVDEPDGPEVDHDIVVLMDDWRLTQKVQIAADFGQIHDWSHGGRLGNYIHARLFPDMQAVQKNQRLRLRFVNTATDRIMQFGMRGMAGHIVALDGMPLQQPIAAETMVLAPAQRVDFIVDVTGDVGEKAQFLIQDRDQVFILSEIPITAQQSANPRDLVAALPPNPIAYLTDVSTARTAELRMTGGAMGGLRKAVYNGQEMDANELIENGQIWAFNGVAGMPEEPLSVVGKGEPLRIPIVNDTVFPHAMHIHGNHFQEVRKDGTLGPLRDTILVQPNETREIAFIGENPGEWLFHCHMLSHQAAGMRTWVRVEA